MASVERSTDVGCLPLSRLAFRRATSTASAGKIDQTYSLMKHCRAIAAVRAKSRSLRAKSRSDLVFVRCRSSRSSATGAETKYASRRAFATILSGPGSTSRSATNAGAAAYATSAIRLQPS